MLLVDGEESFLRS